MLTFADRVKETTAKTGTGSSIALSGAIPGYRTFSSGIGVGNECLFVITDGIGWEIGYGTLASSGILTRLTVESSSNADAAVDWSAGTKVVSLCMPAGSILIGGVDLMRVPRAGEIGSAAFCGSDQIPVNLYTKHVNSAYVLRPNDHGVALFVAGSTTITLPKALDVRPGWAVPVRNYGAGDVTLTAASGETVDDAGAVTFGPGLTLWVARHGDTAFRTF